MKRTGMMVAAALLLSTLAWAAPPDTRLVEAARQHDAATALALIAQGVDVNLADGDGSTALHWGACHGDVALTQALLKAGASVKKLTRIGAMSALFMAARNGHAGVIDVLLKAGADAREANANGTTVLMMAAAS